MKPVLSLYPNKARCSKKWHHKPIFLMHKDAKISQKKRTLANWTQQCTKTIILEEVAFITGTQAWFNIWKSIDGIHHINKLKKSYNINRCRKRIWQYPTPIHDKKKSFSKPGMKANFLNFIQTINKKINKQTHANMILNGEKLDALPPRLAIR